jgi:hypothetical protein
VSLGDSTPFNAAGRREGYPPGVTLVELMHFLSTIEPTSRFSSLYFKDINMWSRVGVYGSCVLRYKISVTNGITTKEPVVIERVSAELCPALAAPSTVPKYITLAA